MLRSSMTESRYSVTAIEGYRFFSTDAWNFQDYIFRLVDITHDTALSLAPLASKASKKPALRAISCVVFTLFRFLHNGKVTSPFVNIVGAL